MPAYRKTKRKKGNNKLTSSKNHTVVIAEREAQSVLEGRRFLKGVSGIKSRSKTSRAVWINFVCIRATLEANANAMQVMTRAVGTTSIKV